MPFKPQGIDAAQSDMLRTISGFAEQRCAMPEVGILVTFDACVRGDDTS